MTARDSTGRQAGGATSDPEELRQEIERTREELGDTVEALAHKADVKARVQERVTDISQRAQATAAQGARTVRNRRAPLAAIGGAVLLAALVILWWRRRA
jgi:ferric-dicitrate binding protein FerR (iron transport regulator)